VQRGHASASTSSPPSTKRLDSGCCESTSQQHPERSSFSSRCESISPFAIQKIQTERFDPSASRSRGIFRTWVSPTSTFHLRVPKPTARSSGVIRQIPRSFIGEKCFKNRKDLVRTLKRWETQYNENRPHLAWNGKTSAERVREPAHHPRFWCESCNYCNGLSVLAAAAPWLYRITPDGSV
jgi:hypothetical protein